MYIYFTIKSGFIYKYTSVNRKIYFLLNNLHNIISDMSNSKESPAFDDGMQACVVKDMIKKFNSLSRHVHTNDMVNATETVSAKPAAITIAQAPAKSTVGFMVKKWEAAYQQQRSTDSKGQCGQQHTTANSDLPTDDNTPKQASVFIVKKLSNSTIPTVGVEKLALNPISSSSSMRAAPTASLTKANNIAIDSTLQSQMTPQSSQIAHQQTQTPETKSEDTQLKLVGTESAATGMRRHVRNFWTPIPLRKFVTYYYWVEQFEQLLSQLSVSAANELKQQINDLLLTWPSDTENTLIQISQLIAQHKAKNNVASISNDAGKWPTTIAYTTEQQQRMLHQLQSGSVQLMRCLSLAAYHQCDTVGKMALVPNSWHNQAMSLNPLLLNKKYMPHMLSSFNKTNSVSLLPCAHNIFNTNCLCEACQKRRNICKYVGIDEKTALAHRRNLPFGSINDLTPKATILGLPFLFDDKQTFVNYAGSRLKRRASSHNLLKAPETNERSHENELRVPAVDIYVDPHLRYLSNTEREEETTALPVNHDMPNDNTNDQS